MARAALGHPGGSSGEQARHRCCGDGLRSQLGILVRRGAEHVSADSAPSAIGFTGERVADAFPEPVVAADLLDVPADQPAHVGDARALTCAFDRDHIEAVEARIDPEPDPRTAYDGSPFGDAMGKAADVGLMTASILEQWGGSGWSATAQLMLVEEGTVARAPVAARRL